MAQVRPVIHAVSPVPADCVSWPRTQNRVYENILRHTNLVPSYRDPKLSLKWARRSRDLYRRVLSVAVRSAETCSPGSSRCRLGARTGGLCPFRRDVVHCSLTPGECTCARPRTPACTPAARWHRRERSRGREHALEPCLRQQRRRSNSMSFR